MAVVHFDYFDFKRRIEQLRRLADKPIQQVHADGIISRPNDRNFFRRRFNAGTLFRRVPGRADNKRRSRFRTGFRKRRSYFVKRKINRDITRGKRFRRKRFADIAFRDNFRARRLRRRKNRLPHSPFVAVQ